MEEYTTSFQQAITTKNAKELRLLLGDQLSRRHSWFRETQEKVLYIMMEVPSEIHIQIQHYQKTLAVFSAMRSFAQWLESQGHRVIYLTLGHKENRGSFLANIQWLQEESGADLLAYQSPDDFRVAEILSGLPGRKTEVSSEHFLSDSQDFPPW
jgi:deoxyribodipyrimidine photolyase-related protein